MSFFARRSAYDIFLVYNVVIAMQLLTHIIRWNVKVQIVNFNFLDIKFSMFCFDEKYRMIVWLSKDQISYKFVYFNPSKDAQSKTKKLKN